MTATMKRVDEDVRDVLRRADTDGPRLWFNETLDRKLYLKVQKVLKAIGAPWSRKAEAHVFEEDAAPVVADVVTTGMYFDSKKHFQFFETPEEIGRQLIAAAEIVQDDKVLEPSAGRGALVRLAIECGAYVDAIELDPSNAKHLASILPIPGSFVIDDFLSIEPVAAYDAIVMNPPFTRGQDIQHVQHAYRFLKPGAALASVMSPGFTFRGDRAARQFRKWAEGIGAEWEFNPEGSFKESGTNVQTLIFRAER